MSVVKEVWYGQRSLAQTYWLWGILVSVIAFLGAFIAALMAIAMGNGFPFFFFVAILMPIHIWYMVGLWRSATNHPSGWATLVKVMYVFSVPYALYNWITLFSMGSEAFH